jgi:mannitol-specific phosphotransferase system IIBC component
VYRRILEWSFGPVILSVGTFVVVLVGIARGKSLSMIAVLPFGTLFVSWIVAFFVLRSRDQRKLLREIGQLRDVETASRNNRKNTKASMDYHAALKPGFPF